MHHMTFDCASIGGTERRSLPIRDLVIGGWTGRDPRKIEEHIEELAALGIPGPTTLPCFYRAGAALPTTAATIDVLGADSSGEVEWVLLLRDDGWWVGIGSDHTDRKVEAYSITVSKQMCPKPVAPVLWRYEEVAPHWDQLELSAEVEEDAAFIPYQQGTAAAMLHPEALVEAYHATGQRFAPDTLLFGGTLPVIGGIRPRAGLQVSLHDPVLQRTIRHGYTARWLPE